jgi:hypothetical protein
MRSKELDNLVRAELIKPEAADQREFDGLFDSGRKRLKDATKAGLATESQFDLAYGAAHSFALAAMRWHGYRPANKRYVVFQALPHTLAIRPEVWRVLDKCHGLRNAFEYDGSFNVSAQLLFDLLRATELLKQKVEKLGPIPKDTAKEM